MKLNELEEWIEANSSIGPDLDKESRRVPDLQAKAINLKARETALLRALELDWDVRKRDRWIYYSGKSNPEIYKQDPFDLKVLKGDMDIFLDADSKMAELRSKIQMQKIKLDMLDEFIKMMNQRTFVIKNILDWNRIQNGLV